MKGIGSALIALGILIAVIAFAMETTVYSPPIPSISGYGGTDAGRTFNLGLLQRQELVFMGGCVLFLAGCMLAAIGQLEAALMRRTPIGAPSTSLAEGDGDLATLHVPAGELAVNRAAVADDTDYNRLFIVIGGILLAILALVMATRPGKSPEAAAIEANADMLADNLEAEADNLEAAADEVLRDADRAIRTGR